MSQSFDHVYKKLEAMQIDLEDLRNTYKGVSKRYMVALSSLNTLTLHSSDAAKRAAKSAVAHQAEESLLKASNEAAVASRMAAEAAAEAVKLSNQAREIVDGIHKKT